MASAPTTHISVEKIDALLPQTQCRRCSFADCKSYAQAIVLQQADINQCPPGGNGTISALADLLGVAPKPLNPAFGEIKPTSRALIVEADCIGCTKCIAACPVDAILGAAKLMHTVIADECTGCELCIPPCPVDCIVMLPAVETPAANDVLTKESAIRFKQRYHQQQQRKQRQLAEQAEKIKKQKQALEEMKARKTLSTP